MNSKTASPTIPAGPTVIGNADREFTSSDLVVAFQDGGYELGPRAAIAVPEPTSLAALLVGLFGVVIMSNTRGETI